ncbi:MAG: hypothetical protein WBX01_11955 [Nitrososphaeraceae archaeon]|jgi:hypothetical protein
MGRLWGNTSNPLNFAIDGIGSVRFTEWSENKSGVLQSDEITNLPFWMTVSKDQLILDASSGEIRRDMVRITIYPNSSFVGELASQNQPEITVATSITPSGKLWNLTTGWFQGNRSSYHLVLTTEMGWNEHVQYISEKRINYKSLLIVNESYCIINTLHMYQWAYCTFIFHFLPL